MDPKRIDAVVQFALLQAGEEDDYFARQLGPIHLIKYVYLADLAHAQANQGETYTGTDWIFHKFGPWSNQVFERVEPAAAEIQAEHKSFRSDYGDDDWHRWIARDDQRLKDRKRSLPSTITLAIRKYVHEFTNDTTSLLHFVYTTAPMIKAAPGERLDFGSLPDREVPAKVPQSEPLSKKKQKRMKQKFSEIRAKMLEKSPSRAHELKTRRLPEPRFDEIFEQGVAWLDSDAGETLPEGDVTAEFSADVWKSDARDPNDIP